MNKIEPVGFNILVEPVEVKAVTAGGIHLPDAVVEKDQHATMRGTVLAVGSGCEYLSSDDIGKIAVFGRYAGALIEDGGKKYRLIDNKDIKALIGG